MNTILGNYIYLSAFYFFVFTPLYSLFLFSTFYFFSKKKSLIEISSRKCFYYFYMACCIASLFAASLSYLLLVSNTGSYYFSIHYFIVVPILSLLSGVVFSGVVDKDYIKYYLSNLGIFLNSISLFISLIYMGLKFYSGK